MTEKKIPMLTSGLHMHISVHTTQTGTYIKIHKGQIDRMLIITNRQTGWYFIEEAKKKILIGSDTVEDASKISYRAV